MPSWRAPNSSSSTSTASGIIAQVKTWIAETPTPAMAARNRTIASPRLGGTKIKADHHHREKQHADDVGDALVGFLDAQAQTGRTRMATMKTVPATIGASSSIPMRYSRK